MPAAPGGGRTALYRHYAEDETLLYVGVSLSVAARLAAHEATSAWFDQIARVDVEWHPTRAAALAAEKHAIKTENPKCNVVHGSAPKRSARAPQRPRPKPAPPAGPKILWGREHLPPLEDLISENEALRGYRTSRFGTPAFAIPDDFPQPWLVKEDNGCERWVYSRKEVEAYKWSHGVHPERFLAPKRWEYGPWSPYVVHERMF